MAVAQINVGFQVNVKELSEKLNQAAGELEKHKAKFQEVGSAIGQAGMYVGRYVDQMAGTVITTIGGVVTFIPEIISGVTKLNAVLVANPWFALATAITAVGTALYFYTKKGNEASQMQKMLNDVNTEALKNTAKERAELDSLVKVAKDVNSLKNDRLNAIKKLNEISPKYLGDITLETINTKKATEAIGQYVDALNAKAREQALMSKKTELYTQLIDKENESLDKVFSAKGFGDALGKLFGDAEAPIIRNREELEKYLETIGDGHWYNKVKANGELFLKVKKEEVNALEKQITALDQYASAERSAGSDVEETRKNTIGYYEKEIQYFENLQKNAAVSAAQHKLYANEILKYKNKIAAIDGGPKLKGDSKEKIKLETIKFYESQISALKKYQQEEAVTVDQFAETANKIQAIQQKIDAITGKREKATAITTDYTPVVEGSTVAMERQIAVLEKQREVIKSVFGEADIRYQALTNQIQDIEFEIKVKVDEAGVISASESLSRITQEAKLQAEIASSILSQKQEEAAMYADIVGGAFDQLSQNFIGSMGEAETGLERFGQAMAGVVLKLISMALSNAMANAIVGATQSGNSTGPAAVFTTPAFIATAVAGILGAFASIPKFANGGIVSGPVLGLMGEYAGASSNPEVIAPLNKLKEMIEPAGGSTLVTLGGGFKLTGSDLQLVLDRNTTRSKRVK